MNLNNHLTSLQNLNMQQPTRVKPKIPKRSHSIQPATYTNDQLALKTQRGALASQISFEKQISKFKQTRKSKLYLGLSAQVYTGEAKRHQDRPATGIGAFVGKISIPYKEDYTIHFSGEMGVMNAKWGQHLHEEFHRFVDSKTHLDKIYKNSKNGLYGQAGLGVQWDPSGNKQSIYPYIQLDGELGVMDNRLKLSGGIKGQLPGFMKGEFSLGVGVSARAKSMLNDRPVLAGVFAEAHMNGERGRSFLGSVKSKSIYLGNVDVLPEGTLYFQSPQYAKRDTSQLFFDLSLVRYNLNQNSHIQLALNNDAIGRTDHGKSGGFTLGYSIDF